MNWKSILKLTRRDATSLAGQSVEPSNRDAVSPPVIGDNPIKRPEDDTLGRAEPARRFARHVLSLDAREGAVIGVLGAWGAGKTSFINLSLEEFKRAQVPVLGFNPWMFSGAEQLVSSFFSELSGQLKSRAELHEVGEYLDTYAEALAGVGWLPVIGAWIERGRLSAKALSKLLRRQRTSLEASRARITEKLRALDRPIVVVLDDIDRLTPEEIQDIFKLVRLTASFPNLIYVVAFDRARVEAALDTLRLPGREYLEKIVQVAFDLPSIPEDVLTKQIFHAIDAAANGIESTGPFHEDQWPDIFHEIVKPLIRSMRDVRRYAAAIRGTILALDGEVALADVLALEVVRIFMPDVFRDLHKIITMLTTVSTRLDDEDPVGKARVDALLQADASQPDVIRSLIDRLFPAAKRYIGGPYYGPDWESRWLTERRVAHGDVLRRYLEGVAGEGLLAFTDAERAFSCIHDRTAFDHYLRSLEPHRQEDVISALENFQAEFRPQQASSGIIVLLNILPHLPARARGMFDFGAKLTISRVVLRLLRSLGTAESVEQTVREILPEVQTLSSKLELIKMVGHDEHAGHKLVPPAVAGELDAAWREAVRTMPSSELATEPDLLQTMIIVKRETPATESALEVDDSPMMTLALLRSAKSDVRSQAFGSRAVQQSPRLAWDALVELFGNEDTLKERLAGLTEGHSTEDQDLLALAQRYADGWKPRMYDD